MLKKILILIGFITLTNCSTNENFINCIEPLPVNVTTNRNNPELINALVPGGVAHLNGGSKGILLINVNGTTFKAFDKLCPSGTCNQPMTLEKSIFLTCPCDNKQYSIIDGSSQTDALDCPAVEYNVFTVGNAIRITN